MVLVPVAAGISMTTITAEALVTVMLRQRPYWQLLTSGELEFAFAFAVAFEFAFVALT